MSIALKTVPATIQAGQSLSSPVLLGDYTLCGMFFPAGWTTGAITMQVSFDDGATYVELNDSSGTAVSLPASASANTYYAIDPRNANLAGATNIKIRSGTVGAPVTQAAAVTVKVIGRRLYPGPS